MILLMHGMFQLIYYLISLVIIQTQTDYTINYFDERFMMGQRLKVTQNINDTCVAYWK